jgi:hypothetical protein
MAVEQHTTSPAASAGSNTTPDRLDIVGRAFELEALLDAVAGPLTSIGTTGLSAQDAATLGNAQTLVSLAQRLAAEMANVAEGRPAQ